MPNNRGCSFRSCPFRQLRFQVSFPRRPRRRLSLFLRFKYQFEAQTEAHQLAQKWGFNASQVWGQDSRPRCNFKERSWFSSIYLFQTLPSAIKSPALLGTYKIVEQMSSSRTYWRQNLFPLAFFLHRVWLIRDICILREGLWVLLNQFYRRFGSCDAEHKQIASPQ